MGTFAVWLIIYVFLWFWNKDIFAEPSNFLKENKFVTESKLIVSMFLISSLQGNEDRNSEIKHILNAGVLARYLRFLPGTYHGGVCLRAEVFGVKQKPGD